MTDTAPGPRKRRPLSESETYARVAPWLTLAIGCIAALGVVVAAIASVQSANASAEARGVSKANAVLVGCLNRYADASASTSQAVRDASAKVTTATIARDTALDVEGVAFLDLVEALRAEKYEPAILEALSESLKDRAAAALVLAQAQADLEQARADNPVPPPPTVFCELKEPSNGDNDTPPQSAIPSSSSASP